MAKEEAFAAFMKTGGIPYVAVMNRTDDCVTEDNCQVSGKHYR